MRVFDLSKWIWCVGCIVGITMLVGCQNNAEEQLEGIGKSWSDRLLIEKEFYGQILHEIESDEMDLSYLKGIATGHKVFITQDHLYEAVNDLMEENIEQSYDESVAVKVVQTLREIEDTSFVIANYMQETKGQALYGNKQFINSLSYLIEAYVDGKGETIASNDLTLMNIVKHPEEIMSTHSSTDIVNRLNSILNNLTILSQNLSVEIEQNLQPVRGKFSYIDELSEDHQKLYNQFQTDHNVNHMKDFSPEEIVLAYFHSAAIHDVEAIYALLYDNGDLPTYEMFQQQYEEKGLSRKDFDLVMRYRYYDSIELQENEYENSVNVVLSVSLETNKDSVIFELKEEQNVWKMNLSHLLKES